MQNEVICIFLLDSSILTLFRIIRENVFRFRSGFWFHKFSGRNREHNKHMTNISKKHLYNKLELIVNIINTKQTYSCS